MKLYGEAPEGGHFPHHDYKLGLCITETTVIIGVPLSGSEWNTMRTAASACPWKTPSAAEDGRGLL